MTTPIGLHDDAAPASATIDGVVPARVESAATIDDVQRLVRDTAEAGGSLIASGRGRHLDVGGAPARCDLLLRLAPLAAIREHHAADMTVTVEAGCTLAALDEVLAAAGQWLPLDAPAPAATTIGGLVAANLSGPLRCSQGTVRDLLLGLRWVSADGTPVAAGGRVVKNVAGYDLHKAHVGALGTLGTVVEATFKVRPRPEHERALVIACADPPAAVATALDARDAVEPAWLEVASAGVLELDAGAGVVVGWLGLDEELDAAERTVRAALAGVGRARVVGALADADARELRLRLADFALEAAAAVLRVATLPDALGHAVATLVDAAGGAGIRWAGHAASGVARVAVVDPDRVAGLVARLRPALEADGGALVVERAGPGVKHALAPHGGVFGDPGPGRALMQRLKDAFDPRRVLAPGRYVAGI